MPKELFHHLISITKWPLVAMTMLYLAFFLETQSSNGKDRRREASFGAVIAIVTYIVLLTENGHPWLHSLLTATLLLIFSPVFIALMTLARKRARGSFFRKPYYRLRFFTHIYGALLLFLPHFRPSIISQETYGLLASSIIIVTTPIVIMSMRKLQLQENKMTSMKEEQEPEK